MPITAKIFSFTHLEKQQKQAPPLVYVHGAAGNCFFWPPELRRLPGQPVYAVDLPGHGKSVGPGFASIASYTAALADWMDSLQLTTAVWIGHSMGSAIALTMALEFPARVAGLGLIGGSANFLVSPAILDQAKNPLTFPKAVEAIMQLSFSRSAPDRLIGLASRRMQEVDPSVLYADLIACEEFDVSDRIDQIASPTLVLCGEEDRMTSLRHSKELAGRIPGAHLEVIPGAGHMVMLEQPAAVKLILLDFLNRAC
jgi:pimeloyl-ACP methyl ester carboxylesterase